MQTVAQKQRLRPNAATRMWHKWGPKAGWRRIRRAFYDRICEFERGEGDTIVCKRCGVVRPYVPNNRRIRRCDRQAKYLGDIVEAIIIVAGLKESGGCGCKRRRDYMNQWSRTWAKWTRRQIEGFWDSEKEFSWQALKNGNGKVVRAELWKARKAPVDRILDDILGKQPR